LVLRTCPDTCNVTEEPEVDDRALIATGAVVLVNVFTPKAGQLDAFVAAQTAESSGSRGRWTGRTATGSCGRWTAARP
jgi:hypothetical protein